MGEELLFVYGTLLPGLAPPEAAALAARLRPLGPAAAPGRLYDLGPYPALVPDSAGRVCGELVAVPDAATLTALDEYEDCAAPGGVFRRVRTVALTSGKKIACWVYSYHGDVRPATPVPHGDYRRWKREPRGAG